MKKGVNDKMDMILNHTTDMRQEDDEICTAF